MCVFESVCVCVCFISLRYNLHVVHATESIESIFFNSQDYATITIY